ncbi:choice-of-anchor J domain-containing protein [Weeksellaceae bacterium KMM 9724]|uniref:T9SS-dependent choice-of-anchor J family protein n=1 Tax=Profundicola chukchiensis TaxID=2961959 RepID=UPI00243B23D6|nr:T9SS type A sorting domain-containing protein [Profundicola chukchiensis]MDG4951460.1 choice-of-anchor J domain-containing protein [Profundicola chukchiensis]
MKNFYFWMLALLCSSLTFGQLSENFESDITTRGWSLYQTDPSDPGFGINTEHKQSGNSSYAHLDEFVDNESTAYMVSPAYTVQSGDEFSVYVRQSFSNSYYNYSGIAISNASGDPIANPTDFVEVWEAGAGFAENSWEQVELALDAYVGQSIYVAFVYRGEFDHQFYVDNMYIGTPCTAPTASLSTTGACDINSFSVSVDLTSLGTAANVIVSDNQGNTQTTSTTGVIEFGPYASGTDVAFTLSDVDNTTCNTVISTSYTCAPSNDNCATATAINSFPFTSSEDATGATQEDFVYCGPDGANDGVWYVIEGQSAEFTINVTSNNWDSAIVLYSGSCDTLSCVQFADNAASNSMETINFIGQAGMTYYLNVGSYSSNADLEEGTFELEVLSNEIPCSAPSNLSVQSTSDLTTDVLWQGGGDNDSFELTWGETGFTPSASANATSLTSTNYTITGLNPETTYDVYVRGNCNPGLSEWVGPVSFTTLEAGAVLPGTDCAHPINVASYPYTTTDNTSNYGDDYDGQPGGCGTTSNYLNGDDVVYALSADENEETSLKISMIPTATWAGMFVYASCEDIGVNCLASDRYSSGIDELIIEELIIPAGETYYLVISTWATPQSTGYDLTISKNTCSAGAFELNPVGACDTNEFFVEVEITDLGDLTEYVITDNQGSEAQTASETGTYTFGPYASETMVMFDLTANDANCSESGSITYRCPGMGDTCDNPILVENLPYLTEDNTANYLDDYNGSPGETGCSTTSAYLNGDDVVYAYTATSDSSINLDMTTSANWTGMFIYTSCEAIGVECATGGVRAGTGGVLIEDFAVTAGQTYYIVISSYPSPQSYSYTLEITENSCVAAEYSLTANGACETNEFFVDVEITDLGSNPSFEITDDQGSEAQTATEAGVYTFGPYESLTEVTFNLVAEDENCNATQSITYRCPNAGDNCENPLIVDSLPYVTEDSTSNYTDEYNGSPGQNCSSTSSYLNGDDVVYSYTPTEDTAINITLDPTNNYAGVFVYESCEDIGTNCIAGGVNSFSSAVIEIEELVVMAGQTYYILISTYASPQSTDYTLTISENTCTGIDFTSSTIDQCETGEYSVALDITSLGTSEFVTISDDQGSAEQTISAPGVVTFGPYTESESVTFNFVTDDENCYESTSVVFTCPASNDDCMDATELTVGNQFGDNSILANNVGATAFAGMPTPTCAYNGGEVWFTAVVPASGNITIQTQDSGYDDFNDSVIAVYNGSCDALNFLSCNDDGGGNGLFSQVILTDLTPGETLYIAVWSYGNNVQGTFLVSAYDGTLGVADVDNRNAVKLYPNPTSSELNISGIELKEVHVYNAAGKFVQVKTTNNVVDTRNLSSGLYFIRMIDMEGNAMLRKFIKK